VTGGAGVNVLRRNACPLGMSCAYLAQARLPYPAGSLPGPTVDAMTEHRKEHNTQLEELARDVGLMVGDEQVDLAEWVQDTGRGGLVLVEPEAVREPEPDDEPATPAPRSSRRSPARGPSGCRSPHTFGGVGGLGVVVGLGDQDQEPVGRRRIGLGDCLVLGVKVVLNRIR
jgi:hypothetical protein